MNENTNSIKNRVNSVFVVAIAGGSGSGKTTFARKLCARLGEEQSALIPQDNYYIDQSEKLKLDASSVNYDHPQSLEFSLLARQLLQLKQGLTVLIPRYCFVTHKRLAHGVVIEPRPMIIVDGILLLSQSYLRQVIDFAIFIDTDEQLRFKRRLVRDVQERGRAPQGVHEQFYRQVKPMHDLFVEPSRQYAQCIVPGDIDFTAKIESLLELWSKDWSQNGPATHLAQSLAAAEVYNP